jgi:hypothetical protein
MRKQTFVVLCILFLPAGMAFLSAAAPSGFMVITWGGNSPEWNRTLHLTGVRIGCSSVPASCLRDVDQIAASQHVSSVFLGIVLNPATVASYSATFGSLAPAHPSLVEVGFDDFVSQCEKTHLGGPELSNLVQTIASNLKSRGSKMQMGATVYQDQLITGALDRLQISDAARQSIDIVHLFPHYRKERKSVADYVTEAKRAFPNAKVILGVYAYDRREYLPCSPDNKTPCSSEDEINFFDQIFREDLKVAETGAAVGIEFFPGNFGTEDSWNGWNSSRSCKQGERDLCVQNTVAMRERVRAAMKDAGL